MTEDKFLDLRYLDAARCRLFRVAGITSLTLEEDRSYIKVTVARAFPISDAEHHIGFLDGAGSDIGIIREPKNLDPDSRSVLEKELELRYFVPVVERVVSVKEEFGSVYFAVETSRGPKEIVARSIRDNLQEIDPTRVILTDVDGNRFEFPDIGKLDSKSFSILMRSV